MSLYLCVFQGGMEVAGFDAGPYSNLNALRTHVAAELEGGSPGARYPTFMLHSDCCGEWSAAECLELQDELVEIIRALNKRGPVAFGPGWQETLAGSTGFVPANASESFIDADAAPLLGSLLDLVGIAIRCGEPILFQ